MRGVHVGASHIRVTVARLRTKVEMGRPAVVNGLEEITTVFIGGLKNTTAEEYLCTYFETIIALKIAPLKSIAFIQYEKRPSVEQAITELKRSHLGGAKIRVSFRRMQLNMGAGVYYVSSYQPQVQPPIVPLHLYPSSI